MFQYLNMLREKGPQQWVHEECRDLDAMKFRFKDKERASAYVTKLCHQLHVSLYDRFTSLSYWSTQHILKKSESVVSQSFDKKF